MNDQWQDNGMALVEQIEGERNNGWFFSRMIKSVYSWLASWRIAEEEKPDNWDQLEQKNQEDHWVSVIFDHPVYDVDADSE